MYDTEKALTHLFLHHALAAPGFTRGLESNGFVKFGHLHYDTDAPRMERQSLQKKL